MAPNFGIESYTNPKIGHHCTVPKVPPIPSSVKTMYCNSLGFIGPQLFNILPKHFRDQCGVGIDVFKKHLLLSKVPDEPTSWQETQKRAALSNPLLYQKPVTEERPLKGDNTGSALVCHSLWGEMYKRIYMYI
ncbi:Hypothetical predicted protein [Octopus vulgaris]|uniref:Uncharacterized protein n=1 Tax=Octopus vulgaris TaxID=6645 RepID=A0AA36B8T1_OCTVU|nr:Hypothetical predicted protein [Octopus vulgaris]